MKTILLQQNVLLHCRNNKGIFSSVRGRENRLILEASVALGLHLIVVRLNSYYVCTQHLTGAVLFLLNFIQPDEGKGTNCVM